MPETLPDSPFLDHGSPDFLALPRSQGARETTCRHLLLPRDPCHWPCIATTGLDLGGRHRLHMKPKRTTVPFAGCVPDLKSHPSQLRQSCRFLAAVDAQEVLRPRSWPACGRLASRLQRLSKRNSEPMVTKSWCDAPATASLHLSLHLRMPAGFRKGLGPNALLLTSTSRLLQTRRTGNSAWRKSRLRESTAMATDVSHPSESKTRHLAIAAAHGGNKHWLVND